jgi:hypothetical protein
MQPSEGGTFEIAGLNVMYEATRVKSFIVGRDLNPGGRGDGRYYAQGGFSAGSLRPMPTTTPVSGWGNSVNNGCAASEPPCSNGNGGDIPEIPVPDVELPPDQCKQIMAQLIKAWNEQYRKINDDYHKKWDSTREWYKQMAVEFQRIRTQIEREHSQDISRCIDEYDLLMDVCNDINQECTALCEIPELWQACIACLWEYAMCLNFADAWLKGCLKRADELYYKKLADFREALHKAEVQCREAFKTLNLQYFQDMSFFWMDQSEAARKFLGSWCCINEIIDCSPVEDIYYNQETKYPPQGRNDYLDVCRFSQIGI